MEYTKEDSTTLKVVTPTVTTEEVQTYNIDFLKEQEISILKNKNDFIESRDKELVEVRTLIAKCKELGIVSKVETDLTTEKIREVVLDPIV